MERYWPKQKQIFLIRDTYNMKKQDEGTSYGWVYSREKIFIISMLGYKFPI